MTDRIDFTPTPADLAAAARDLRPRNWGRWDRARLVGAGVLIALLIFFVIARYVWQQHGVYIVYWEDAAAFSFAGAVLGWLYGRKDGRISADDSRLAARSFILGTDGIETRGKDFETRIAWAGVAEIAGKRDTLFFITRWKEYFFIPKRAFADARAAAAFEQKARDYLAARGERIAAEAAEARKIPHRFDLAYRLERSDIAAFVALRREIVGWRKLLLFLPPFILGGLAAFLHDASPTVAAWFEGAGLSGIVFAVILGAGLWYAAATATMAVLRALRVWRTRLPEGETRLTADRHGVRVAADGTSDQYGWREIGAVTLGDVHVFLSTAPTKAVIVPLRAFPSREAMIEFYAFAEEASQHADS